ncbi:transcription termination factor Rho [Pelagicoccus sp. SDUM812005]|uniref:transcription termination factor Rho n=1 Tax=Pelagicoccus sp. SDUM812005 TaxID=3041257 RepID=UPI00281099A2|nr:transcription termination factor Rho [Pelagicoccus sp. SDUM812005]MDQ8179788.1 transcription termination factor Rho [Pelagicoccus sp. SDUM812005]
MRSVMDNENAPQEETITVEGVLEVTKKKTGQLLDLSKNGRQRPTDPFVPKELIRRFKLRSGSHIVAQATADPRFQNPKVRFIEQVDGVSVEERRKFMPFSQLTTITPEEQIRLETDKKKMTTRCMDLFCPIGKGTRGLIVAPPRTGKTTLLTHIAQGINANHPEIHLMVLLIDERPEEVTDFRRNIDAEVWASSNDEELPSHLRVAELCIERAKCLVETGKDVVILMDSITRLARAHNAASKGKRTMSGGLDIRALEKPRQIFAAARNTEEAGSLTIIASALIETGSRMDDMIFQEFKGTGNMEMVLDRKIADMRIYPAMNIATSGTRREELLIPEDKLDGIHFFRRALVQQKPEDAAETMITRLSKTDSNQELLDLISR